MGIPRYRLLISVVSMGKDMYRFDLNDFFKEEYKEINYHVIVARITAENPYEGFWPTLGSNVRIKFQSISIG